MGRNVVALGDLAADVTFMDGSSGHLQSIYTYTITAELGDLENIWNYGYKVIDRTTRTINGGVDVLKKNVSNEDKKSVNTSIAQAYGLRAYAAFILVNIYGLPYSAKNLNTLGLVVVDKKPIELFEKISRSTVQQTYQQILADIASSKKYFQDGSQESGYKFGYAALLSLEARVNLFMGEYDLAITAANSALALMSKGAVILDRTKYTDMWKSTTLTDEDIFTIAKIESDNLSANSLNTLYSTYGGFVNPQQVELYAENDLRRGLLRFDEQNNGWRGLKYDGTATNKAVSNIRIFSVPELYLILAECYAQKDLIADSQANLLKVAQRNPVIKTINDLPANKIDLLTFIYEENGREFFQEGHRWFDLRRTGSTMNRTSGPKKIVNYAVYNFRYPIPTYEVDASKIEQNDKWSDDLPK